jgi:LysM repeat protein
VPVKIATPDSDGRIYHVVQAGQSFWSIAIAYQITIQDLETWNNISRTTPLQAGQRLYIPGKDTKGFATPTPFGRVALAAPDENGRIVHEVQPYQALINIADAYRVPIDQILRLNGWQSDWPLQIGQKLLITAGNVTPSATLSPIQMLTPAEDGRYYHTIHSGETLSWIAGLYGVSLLDLMNWNGLNNTSVIRPEQKLLLNVTPPATATSTADPVTNTASPFPTIATSTPTLAPTPEDTPSQSGSSILLIAGLVTIVASGFFWWRFSRKSQGTTPSDSI